MGLYIGNTKYKIMVGNQKEDFVIHRLYDAQIEFLQSSGTQYINTGIVLNDANYIIDAVFSISTSTNRTYAALFTNRENNKDTYGFAINGTNTFINPCNNPNNGISVRYSYETIYSLKLQRGKVVLNGNTYTNTTYKNSYTQNSLWIFRQRFNNTCLSGKLYSLSITHNESIIADFIPVRDGQEGCLYDRVSGTLFKNAGTGSFTLGPDIT